MSDVRNDLSELTAVDLHDACKLECSSEWKMRKLIKEGEYESYIDGNRRKITLRSIKARRERLLKAQASSPTIPPAKAWEQAVAVRAERRRAADRSDARPSLRSVKLKTQGPIGSESDNTK
jgi:hypothetical protein